MQANYLGGDESSVMSSSAGPRASEDKESEYTITSFDRRAWQSNSRACPEAKMELVTSATVLPIHSIVQLHAPISKPELSAIIINVPL